MTLDQLRIFVAVASRQHVTQAAQALNLTQSTVSGAINALEARHVVKLFDRVGRRIELTQEGAIFLEEAQAILRLVEKAEATLDDLSSLRRGLVRIHASQTIASYWLAPRLARFRHDHPQIDVRLEIGNTAQGAAAVLNGDADIGFIEGVVDEPGLAIQNVARDRIMVVVGAGHPWTKSPPQDIRELFTGTGWVLREQGSGTRSTLESAMLDLGIKPMDINIVMELPSNEAACAAVEDGQFATAVSEYVVRSRLAAGTLSALPIELPDRAFSLIRHKERHRTKASELFVEFVRRAFTP
ncbi:MAG: LysR substrate-binding domain-containing protein [Rhizobiaceae bacterium]|nr:LysR substrate-binding domain-containing protein [Rhizobiaceae bacterium]